MGINNIIIGNRNNIVAISIGKLNKKNSYTRMQYALRLSMYLIVYLIFLLQFEPVDITDKQTKCSNTRKRKDFSELKAKIQFTLIIVLYLVRNIQL